MTGAYPGVFFLCYSRTAQERKVRWAVSGDIYVTPVPIPNTAVKGAETGFDPAAFMSWEGFNYEDEILGVY